MNIQEIVEQLDHVGYVILNDPLPEHLTPRLLTRCQDDDQLRFRPARIGRGEAKQQNNAIRGDLISWLDEADSTDQAYLAWMETLRQGLNASLFLGLFDYECHYAIYGAGAGYAKHLDALKGQKNRVVSTVFYLNENWQAGDGGELAVFDPTGNSVIATVKPTIGTMIIFLSETFPHEVLVSHQQRRSIAGWFRVREGA